MTRRLAFALLAALLPAPPVAADPVVVELFTSQGCPACPPADALLGRLAERDDVIALALHVDYWDWMGWEDTFGHPAHTAKQKAYAAGQGSNMVYTPQFVINGHEFVAAPDPMELIDAIARHDGQTGDLLAIEGGRLRIAAGRGEAELLLLTVLPEAAISITDGENAGQDRRFHAVVRDVARLGRWTGAPMQLALPQPPDGLRQVVIAQESVDGRPGPIRGAALRD